MIGNVTVSLNRPQVICQHLGLLLLFVFLLWFAGRLMGNVVALFGAPVPESTLALIIAMGLLETVVLIFPIMKLYPRVRVREFADIDPGGRRILIAMITVFSLSWTLLIAAGVANLHPLSRLAVSIPLGLAALGCLGVLVPVMEEVVFRGWILGEAWLVFPPWIAVVWTSFAFVLVHAVMSPAAIILIAPLGLTLTLVRVCARSLMPGIVLHGMHNSFVMLSAWLFA